MITALLVKILLFATMAPLSAQRRPGSGSDLGSPLPSLSDVEPYLALAPVANGKKDKTAFENWSDALTDILTPATVEKQTTRTSVTFIGHSKTPVVVMDDALPANNYTFIRDFFRNSTSFVQSDKYQQQHAINFPGKIAPLDKSILGMLLEVIGASRKVTNTFGTLSYEKNVVGFAGIQCHSGGSHLGDYMKLFHDKALSLTAVLHFGFGKNSQEKSTEMPRTPRILRTPTTVFYRETKTGLERRYNFGNRTNICKAVPLSAICEVIEEAPKLSPSLRQTELLEEIYQVKNLPNRLVLYPKDILRGTSYQRHGSTEGPLPCSGQLGHLSISLFGLIQDLANKSNAQQENLETVRPPSESESESKKMHQNQNQNPTRRLLLARKPGSRRKRRQLGDYPGDDNCKTKFGGISYYDHSDNQGCKTWSSFSAGGNKCIKNGRRRRCCISKCQEYNTCTYDQSWECSECNSNSYLTGSYRDSNLGGNRKWDEVRHCRLCTGGHYCNGGTSVVECPSGT